MVKRRLNELRKKIQRIGRKKSARSRTAAEEKAKEIAALKDEFVRIRSTKGIEAAREFLRKKGFKGPIF